MATKPSPAFSINSTAGTTSVSVAAGAAIVATIDDISGVSPVSWSVEKTDDTLTPASFSFAQSGSVGQTYTGTALTAGTCATLKCTVSGGSDPTTGVASTEMVARRKFFTPTLEGLEVLVMSELDDDNLESDATHGAVTPINASIRSAGGGAGAWKGPVRFATTGALVAHTGTGTLTRTGNGAFPTTDGVAPAVSDLLLVKNEGATDTEHGIYEITDLGSGGTPWIITRHEFSDEDAEVISGMAVFVSEGTLNGGHTFRLTTADPIVVDTTAIAFSDSVSVVGFVHADSYVSVGLAPSTVGGVRLTNAAGLYSKAVGGATSDLALVILDATDDIRIGSNTADQNEIHLDVPTGNIIVCSIAATPVLTIAGAAITAAQTVNVTGAVTTTTSVSATTFVHGTTYVSTGASPALNGAFRLPNADFLKARGSGAYDIAIVEVDASDNIKVGWDDTNQGDIHLFAPTGQEIAVNIDSAERFTVSETLITIRESLVYLPSGDATITAAGGITVTNSIMRVVGDGGAIDITAVPQIAAGTDGQLVIIQGTSDVNTVKLDDGTGLALDATASVTLGNNDTIQLMYDSGEALWLELSRTNLA